MPMFIEFNQYLKFNKAPSLIYANLDFLIRKKVDVKKIWETYPMKNVGELINSTWVVGISTVCASKSCRKNWQYSQRFWTISNLHAYCFVSKFLRIVYIAYKTNLHTSV